MLPEYSTHSSSSPIEAESDWQEWSAARWNQELLQYCFLRDPYRLPSSPIRASEEDLPELVGDPDADPHAMADSLLQALRWQARQLDLDPLAYAARRLRLFQTTTSRPPDFFAFLWFTCLIAHGYPDADIDGRFHARFDRFFPSSARQFLPCLPLLWQALADWLNQGREHGGQPFSGLQLPSVGNNSRLISHSWKLAFPRLLDRRRLQQALEQQELRGEQLSSRNPILLDQLSNQPFSAPFLAELQQHSQALQQDPDHSGWFGTVLDREISRVQARRVLPLASAAPATDRPASPVTSTWGPLLLTSTGFSLGLICLHPPGEDPPEGFQVQDNNGWLPDQSVLVPADDEPGDYAPFDAGSMLLDPSAPPLPALARVLGRGVLVFAVDTTLELPRLLLAPQPGLQPSHVLVHIDHVDAFQARFDADGANVQEEDWRGFRAVEASIEELFRFPGPAASGQQVEQRSRLSTFSGLRLSQGEGFLAAGLGLPMVRVHGPAQAIKVLALDADGHLADYEPCGTASDGEAEQPGQPQQWQPTTASRQRTAFSAGVGRVVSFFRDGPTIEQRLPLAQVGLQPRFARHADLRCREDWGLSLGPLQLQSPDRSPHTPTPDAVARARSLLNHGSNVCRPAIEQQVLDGLCAAFQRKEAISRFDALLLLTRLEARGTNWPLYGEACLRGWCEGGWVEEGIEPRRGNWRLQPIDPRLVRLNHQQAQLVGLVSAGRLVQLIAHALDLGLQVSAVNPSCPEMPRGWRFEGSIEELSRRSALPLVALEAWIPPDLSQVSWTIETLPCDGKATWPRTSRATTFHNDRIRAMRDGAHQDCQVAVGDKPPPDLALLLERNCFGHYRWHSRDPADGRLFISCQRNRAALDRIIAATDGLWPYGIPDYSEPVVERLYDADAYLPLPLARLAALTGARMPGPTRPPSRHLHTYRYCFSSDVLKALVACRELPLTRFHRPRS